MCLKIEHSLRIVSRGLAWETSLRNDIPRICKGLPRIFSINNGEFTALIEANSFISSSFSLINTLRVTIITLLLLTGDITFCQILTTLDTFYPNAWYNHRYNIYGTTHINSRHALIIHAPTHTRCCSLLSNSTSPCFFEELGSSYNIKPRIKRVNK